MKNSYTKNYKTYHVNKFLNQKELTLKCYAEKEGINVVTFRGWIRNHELAHKVTTKNVSRTTKTAFAENKNKYEYIIIGYGVLITLVLLVATICYIIK